MTKKDLKELAEMVAELLSATIADAVAEKLKIYHKAVLNLEEVAAYMGVSKSMLYSLTRNREIPHSKPTGRMCFFEREALEQWMMSAPVMTNGDISREVQRYCQANPTMAVPRPRGHKSARV